MTDCSAKSSRIQTGNHKGPVPVYAQTFGIESSEMQAVFALYYLCQCQYIREPVAMVTELWLLFE